MEIVKPLFSPGSEGLLSPLAHFFQDTQVNEILINHPEEVFIDKNGQMEQHRMPLLSERHLKHLFTFIANENNQCLNADTPILSGNLQDGSRVQLVIPPVARHYTLSIRRASIKKLNLDDYREAGFYNEARPFDVSNESVSTNIQEGMLSNLYQQGLWADFIALAIRLKKNIVISGATSSGKTTFLNACTAYIPHHERIITLEDTWEVDLPHSNRVSLLTVKKAGHQKTAISMQELVQCTLRLRPDRIIMGEIRGREILDFISACATGHAGSITSIHAANPRAAFLRMVQLYKQNNVPAMRDEDILTELHAVIDVVIQLVKTEKGREVSFIYYKGETNA